MPSFVDYRAHSARSFVAKRPLRWAFFCPETHVLGTLFFSEFRLKKLLIKQEIGGLSPSRNRTFVGHLSD